MLNLRQISIAKDYSKGFDYDMEEKIDQVYHMLKEEGVVHRPLGPLP